MFLLDDDDKSYYERVKERIFLSISEWTSSGRIYEPKSFKVICDETNNTIATVDHNKLHVELFIVPYEAWFYDEDDSDDDNEAKE